MDKKELKSVQAGKMDEMRVFADGSLFFDQLPGFSFPSSLLESTLLNDKELKAVHGGWRIIWIGGIPVPTLDDSEMYIQPPADEPVKPCLACGLANGGVDINLSEL